MKLIQKPFSLFYLSVILFLLNPVASYAQELTGNDAKEYNPYVEPGFYRTYDDFVKGNITKVPTIFYWGRWYTIVNGKRGDETSYGAGKIWGFIDGQGFSWYIYPEKKTKYRILATGKIWVYCSEFVTINTNDSGKVTDISFYCKQGDKFKYSVFISNGPNSELLKCDEDNLKKLLGDDAVIVAEIKDKGIHESNTNKWGDSLNDVLTWVNDYNLTHK